MSDSIVGRNPYPRRRIAGDEAAANRLQRKRSVALPPNFLDRLAGEKLFQREGVAVKLCLTLYAMSGVSDDTVQVTYDGLWPLVLGVNEPRGPARLIEGMRRLEPTGLAARDGSARGGNWFRLEKGYKYPYFVTTNLWSTGVIGNWSGPRLGIYLWLARSTTQSPRRAAPRSTGFARISAAPAVLHLSQRALRAPFRDLEDEGLTVTVRKDGERWIQLVNPDLWPIAEWPRR